MTRPTPAAGGPQRGARPVGEPTRRRRPWWLLALLVIAAIIVILLLVSRCGTSTTTTTTPAAGSATGSATATTASDSASAATGSETPSPSESAGSAGSAATSATTGGPTPGAATPPAAPATPAGGPLTANGTPLLPLTTAAPDGTLTRYVGQSATATGVLVQSVPADEGFWVGDSTTDRVWVQIIGVGESPYQVTVGDTVDFTGTVLGHGGDYPAIVGLSAPDGADQLIAEAAHIEVPKGGVTLTK